MRYTSGFIYYICGERLNLGFLTRDLRISSRKFLAAILLNSGTLAWFFLLIYYLKEFFPAISLNDPLWSSYQIGECLFFGSAIIWAIVNSVIGSRINRRYILGSSILLGTFSTMLAAVVQGTFFAAIISFLLGMSLGLGLPSSMAVVADYTVVEERARVSGTVILGAFILAIGTIGVIGLLQLEILTAVLLFALVRSTSILALIFDKCNVERSELQEKTRLPSGAYREFFFYLAPWVMFTIAAGLASNLIPPDIDKSFGEAMRFVFIAVFGFGSGIAADKFGRRKSIMAGTLILGTSFALIGLFGMSQTLVTVYLAISGIAWGLFFVVFLAVPGDLSVLSSREKFYGLGYILPIAILFGLASVPFLYFPPGVEESVTQMLSLFIYLSIIPVWRAKETLPEGKMRERKLRDYTEKVGEIIKESRKRR
jgi:MFS family permease